MSSTLTVKKSVTIPGDIIDQVEPRLGSGGLSAYVTRALATQLQIDQLTEYVEVTQRSEGPIPADVLHQMREDLAAARALIAS
jgi:hypothetical protein